MSAALFAGFGVVLVASSLFVILHRNPVTSALFLVLAFCSLAGIYLVLQAEFIGMVQIIVYAGAIMVLFLFVIMYLNLRHEVEGGAQVALRRLLGWLIGGMLLLEGAMLFAGRWAMGPVSPAPPGPPVGNTQALGTLLYSRYLFPFEVTSFVLLVAIVGVVVLARGSRGADAGGRGGVRRAAGLSRVAATGAGGGATGAPGIPAAAEPPDSHAPTDDGGGEPRSESEVGATGGRG